MVPHTGETDRPPPKAELEDGVKIEVNVDAASRGSSVSSSTLPGAAKKEDAGRREEMEQCGEQEVFSQEGGKFRTLSWWYGKLHKTEWFYCWC
jgi:hypothetical protein